MSRIFRVNAMVALAMTLALWSAAPDTPVADAAMMGDVESVRSLVRQGADVNAAHGDGMTALHWAAANGKPDMAQILIHAGATVDARTRIGSHTALHVAAEAGQGAVVRVLLDAGADVHATTTTGGATALHFAAKSGSADAVRALLERGADANALEGEWEQTPLMFAAAGNRVDVIRVLVEHGADPSLTGRSVNISLQDQIDAEAEKRRQWVLATLMAGPSEGQDAGRPGWETTVRSQAQAMAPKEGTANLEKGKVDPLSRRLSYADLVGDYGGFAPLHLAAREGHVESVKALLASGADINQVSGGDHSSPVLVATVNGHFDLAKVLIEAGADPRIASDGGATPLFAAINAQWIPKSRHPQPADYTQQQTTYLELMKVLLDAGADPNARLTKHPWYTEYARSDLGVDMMGATAFWRAAHGLDIEAMELLVAYGADPNIPTMKPFERNVYDGSSTADPSERMGDRDPSGLPPVPTGGPGVYPIHAAAGVGFGQGFAGYVHRHVPDAWLETVKYLVEEHGADVNARDLDGYTPVHHAAARGDNEVIRYLVEKGADVTAVARSGQTTVDMANGPVQRINPFPETIELLESLGAKNNHRCLSC